MSKSLREMFERAGAKVGEPDKDNRLQPKLTDRKGQLQMTVLKRFMSEDQLNEFLGQYENNKKKAFGNWSNASGGFLRKMESYIPTPEQIAAFYAFINGEEAAKKTSEAFYPENKPVGGGIYSTLYRELLKVSVYELNKANGK